MIRLRSIAAAIIVTSAVPAFAAGPFDGTWKDDVSTVKPSTKPSVRALKSGVYTCSTCIPEVRVAADGKMHPVAGQAYYDAMAVTIVDPMTVKTTMQKSGKTVVDTTWAVGDGGKTLTRTFTDNTSASGVAVTGTAVEDRVAAGPAGSHAVSGSWVATNKGKVSDSGTTYSFVTDGDMVSLKLATGSAYTAKIDGPEAPVTGDPGWTSVAVKRGGPNTLIETDYRDGKPISRLKMTVSDDGRTLTTEMLDLRRDKTSIITATKQ